VFLHYINEPADPHSLGNDMVWALLEDSEGVLWVGTHTGLDRLDRDSGQFAHYPSPPVFAIHQDREGTIWIGTWAGGLGRLDAETGRFTYLNYDPANPNSLSDDTPLIIHEDQQGVFWIGTFDGGLNSFDPKRERFVRYQNDLADPMTLSSDTVLAIHEDSQGILWLGTGGGGLNRFDPIAGTFRSYTEKDGLPNDTVYGILEDDVPPEEGGPNLWLSTNRGLSRFNPQTGVVQNYDVGDGLQSNEFNQGAYHKGYSGQMFFGGVNGFNAFYPKQVRENPHVPPVVLTALTQGGEEVEAGTTVEALAAVSFEWPRNFFEFEFAALNYSRPEKNQYAYKLDGFDPDWIEAGNRRFGRYTNLPGGNYTLRVKGSNSDGIWNAEGTSLAVTIVPPFWQTWWFRGTVVLLLVGAAIGAYGLRIRSIEKRSRELEAQVADRTQELAALNAVAAVVSRSLDLQEILNDALIKTMEVTGMEAGGVYLLDAHAGLLTLAAHRGFRPEFVEEIDRLGLGEGFSGRVAQSGQPLAVRDISADERLSRTAVRDEGFHSLASIPLDAKGGVIGTLFVVSHGYREFADQDVQLLTSIGHQIGVALENARLYEDASHRLAHLTALQETTRALASTLDLDRLLDLIIQQATSLVQADGGIINLVDWEKQKDEVVAASGIASHFLGGRSSLEVSLSGWVTLHNQPLISNQVPTDSRVHQSALSWVTAVQVQSAAVIPLTIKNQVVGTLVVLGQQGGKEEFGQPDLDLLVSFADQAATAINNAQLFKAEQRRADELEALRSTMGDITAELELSALLQVIVERAASLLDATGGELGLYDEAKQELRIVVSHNLGQDYVGTLHSLGEGAMGRVAETGQPLIIDDYQTWYGGLSQYPHVHATLAAPLKVGDRLVGAFTTITVDPDRRFTPTDLHLLTLFAQQATIAIENARLYEQAQQLAVVEERQRLARDLHDSVTQALYGMALYSEAAAEELSLNHVDLVTEYLGELEETAREALGEMRLLIHELRPPLLAQEGLVAALQDRLQAVEGRAGLTIKFTVDVEGRLPPEIEEGLYRIAREALNNVLKHAQATNVVVEIRHQPEDGMIALAVSDDGVGFDLVSARTQGGLGLSAMEERVAVLGGKLVIDSNPGAGTRVLVEVST
jgi:signal transduction histidine kinase